MRCLICERFSFFHICKNCQELFLAPSLYKRKLTSDIEVVSFYKYEDIKPFLHTKHTDLGYHIFHILAKNSFTPFARSFFWQQKVASVAIDDRVKEGYSHTAILNHALNSKNITPYYGRLYAQNNVIYSSKSKQYREQHPRDFQFGSFKEKEVIIVDDIITTGTTLSQAINVMEQNNKEVLFCLTLADAQKG